MAGKSKTAGKKGAAPKPAAADKKVKLGEVISKAKLAELMKAKRSLANDVGEMNRGVGKMVRSAIANNHLHSKAFGWICQLDRMEPEKARELLDNFEYYLDVSGIGARAAAAERLPLGDDEDGTEADTGNITKLHQDAAE